MNEWSNNSTRFTAWCAVIGGLLAYVNVGLVVGATGGDNSLLFDGAAVLALPAERREWFRLGMAADVVGFYLPVMVIGVYLWNRFRSAAGAMGDIALWAITVYVVVGIAGAVVQMAALQPLAALHAAGDPAGRLACEATWTALANACQKGLWWSEGPVVVLWGGVVGPHLARAGSSRLATLLLKLTGWCFGAFFVVGLFPSLQKLSDLFLVIVVLVFPLWMILFGRQLFRTAC